ncbi:hypothetical protein N7465_003150 [Penicillium sp. CMV-2018d]|nr:hypothetical protein N7465_003150 [Penicillium sp. CMV-2018d]
MKFLNILATGFFSFAVQAAVPSNSNTEAKLAQIKELLTPQLSVNATIVFPKSEKWYDVTHRAAAPRVNPGYLAVVDVATEDDVTELAIAREFGERLQVASRNGEIAHSYVNYAIGGEELPQVYGRDVNRLEKLQVIKTKFDPYNKFGFYASLAGPWGQR